MTGLAIGAAISSLKTAGDIAGGFLKLRDLAQVQGKVIELQSIILTAQQSALVAQSEQFALSDEKRSLEKQVADLEAWQREKDRYKLEQVGRGTFAYVLRPEAQDSEPPHMICPTCYEEGRKSILQAAEAARGQRIHRCPSCRAEVAGNMPPMGPLPYASTVGAV